MIVYTVKVEVTIKVDKGVSLNAEPRVEIFVDRDTAAAYVGDVLLMAESLGGFYEHVEHSHEDNSVCVFNVTFNEDVTGVITFEPVEVMEVNLN